MLWFANQTKGEEREIFVVLGDRAADEIGNNVKFTTTADAHLAMFNRSKISEMNLIPMRQTELVAVCFINRMAREMLACVCCKPKRKRLGQRWVERERSNCIALDYLYKAHTRTSSHSVARNTSNIVIETTTNQTIPDPTPDQTNSKNDILRLQTQTREMKN